MLPFITAMLLGSTAAPITYTTLVGDNDSSVTISGGGLVATKDATTGGGYAFGGHGKTTGKWRFQVTVNNAVADMSIGISGGLFVNRQSFLGGGDSNSIGLDWTATNGVLYGGVTKYNSGANMASADVYDVYADLDAKTVWFARNGVVISGNPALGTGGTVCAAMIKAWYPACFLSGAAGKVTFNFGATAFTYAGAAGFNAWSADVAPASLAQFRSFAMMVRSVGYFAQAWAETELMTVSGGANMLSGSTVTGSVAFLAGDPGSNSIDANTTTYVALTTNGSGSANQGNIWVAYELAANAARNAAFMAVRGRDGGGLSETQAPRLFDLWVSDGPAATGNWYKARQGITLGAFAATTPGQRQEFAL